MAITTIPLGKVLITFKGAWVGGASYEKLDVVTRNDSSFLCIKDAPIGILLTNSEYWTPLSLGAYDYIKLQGYSGTAEQFVIDLTDVSNKISATNIANNLTTETAGKVLDARQGKLLNDGKVNSAAIKQAYGSSTTDLISQKKLTDSTEDYEEVTAQSLVELRARLNALEEIIRLGVFKNLLVEKLDTINEFNLFGKNNLFITGTVVPDFVPDFIGQFYIKTTSTKGAWIATGNSAVADWLLIG